MIDFSRRLKVATARNKLSNIAKSLINNISEIDCKQKALREEQYKADIKRLRDKIEFEEQCG